MFCSQVAARKRHTMGLRSDVLAGILESEITSISWLKYPHEKDAPSDPQRIIKHSALIGRLHDVASNLSFSKTVVEAALSGILQKRLEDKTWTMSEAEASNWTVTMAARIRLMCRHTQQAILKNPKTSWLRLMPFASSTPPPAAAKKSASSSPGPAARRIAKKSSASPAAEKSSPISSPGPPPADYIFGFNPEMHKAWRVLRSKPKSKQELCMEIVAPKGATDHDLCEAVWPDDSRTAIAELTVQAHQASHRPSPGASSANTWQKLHTVTKNVISVRKRVDRCLLVSIYEQGAQVCQVNVHAKFGETSAAIDKALEFMVTLATEYVENKIQKKDLFPRRNAMLEAVPKVAQPPGASRACKQGTDHEKEKEGFLNKNKHGQKKKKKKKTVAKEKKDDTGKNAKDATEEEESKDEETAEKEEENETAKEEQKLDENEEEEEEDTEEEEEEPAVRKKPVMRKPAASAKRPAASDASTTAVAQQQQPQQQPQQQQQPALKRARSFIVDIPPAMEDFMENMPRLKDLRLMEAES